MSGQLEELIKANGSNLDNLAKDLSEAKIEITPDIVNQIYNQSGQQPKDIIEALSKNGLPVPPSVIDGIEAQSNNVTDTGESLILPGLNNTEEGNKETKEEEKESKDKIITFISELFQSLISEGNYEAIVAKFGKEEIVGTRVEEGKKIEVTRQGAIRENINADIAELRDLEGEEKEVKQKKIKEKYAISDLKGSDLAETRDVIVGGKDYKDRVSVSGMNDEELVKIIATGNIQAIREAQEDAAVRDEFNKDPSEKEQSVKKSQLMEDLRDFHEFKALKAKIAAGLKQDPQDHDTNKEDTSPNKENESSNLDVSQGQSWAERVGGSKAGLNLKSFQPRNSPTEGGRH